LTEKQQSKGRFRFIFDNPKNGADAVAHCGNRVAEGQERREDPMLQPILVPLDGSDLAEQALPYAEALAAPGCQLILLEVGQDEEELRLLERHAESCARLETATGDPAQQILQVARDLGAGLIVMTTHGRGAVGRWAFGSVADTVTRTAPVPVMVIRPRAGDAEAVPVMRRVVVPLDGSPLAEQALPIAQALAQQLHAPVHLVTAIDLTSLLPVEMMPTVAFDASLYAETVAQLRSGAEAWLAEAARQLQCAGVTATWEVLSGSPFLVISDVVAAGDLLVMVSHGRSGAQRWLLGSVAEKLIREAPVPVVLVPTGDRRDDQTAGVAAEPGALPAT
jgi:nucleotide-binding universal stress UspA family protein